MYYLHRIIIAVVTTAVAVLGMVWVPSSALAGDNTPADLTPRSGNLIVDRSDPNAVRDAKAVVSTASVGSVCGSSYSQVGAYAMKNSSGVRKGTYLVGWNGTRNCGVAECYTNCGTLMYRQASIRRSSDQGWPDVDEGNFRYYAGPVYTGPSTGVCISIRGVFGIDGSVAYLLRDNIHCG